MSRHKDKGAAIYIEEEEDKDNKGATIYIDEFQRRMERRHKFQKVLFMVVYMVNVLLYWVSRRKQKKNLRSPLRGGFM